MRYEDNPKVLQHIEQEVLKEYNQKDKRNKINTKHRDHTKGSHVSKGTQRQLKGGTDWFNNEYVTIKIK